MPSRVPACKMSMVTLPMEKVIGEALGMDTVPAMLVPSGRGWRRMLTEVTLKPENLLRPGLGRGLVSQ